MAWEFGVLDMTCIAAADLRTKQYYLVEIVSGGGAQDAPSVNVCGATTDKPLGILQTKPNTGGECSVRLLGISKVVADAALTQDANYGTSADGQAVAKTADHDYVLGRVLRGVSNAGELATVTVNGLSLTSLSV